MPSRFVEHALLWEHLSGALYNGDAACRCRGEDCPLCTANFGMGALRLESVGEPVTLGEEVSKLGARTGLGGDPVGRNSLEAMTSLGSGDHTPPGFLAPHLSERLFASTSGTDGSLDPRIPGDSGAIQVPDYLEVSADLAPPLNAVLYVSAGPHNEFGSCEFGNCNNCSIYKVTLESRGTKVRYRVEQLVAPHIQGGAFAPAVSPDGNKVAFCRQTTRNERGFLRVLYQNTGKVEEVAEGNKSTYEKRGEVYHSPPLFPAWYGDNRLLYSASAGGFIIGSNSDTDDQPWTVYGVDFYDSGGFSSSLMAYLGEGSPYNARVGGGGLYFKTAFADTAVLQPGRIVHGVSGAEMRIATQGTSQLIGMGAKTRKSPGKPRVSALVNTSNPIETQEFLLGTNGSGETITEAHHAAWDNTGSRILVYVHEPQEQLDASSTVKTRLLYEYERGFEGTWRNPQRAFRHKSPSEILFDLNEGGSLFARRADLFFYKYPQYCHSGDYVIFVLFCTADTEVQGSRVMVVQKSTDTYWDITSLVEDWYSCERGELRGYISTCAKCSNGGSSQ